MVENVYYFAALFAGLGMIAGAVIMAARNRIAGDKLAKERKQYGA